MPTVEFTIVGDPVPKGRPQFTRAGKVYTPLKTRNYAKLIVHYAVLAMRGREPYSGAVMVKLEIIFKPPKSWPKYKKKAAINGEIPHIKKPDSDNVVKAIFDGMNLIVYEDDAQINDHRVTKKYGEKSFVNVIIKGDE